MRNCIEMTGVLTVAALILTGTLTNEGVECPAMRGDDGQLYTLVGELGGFKPGAAVQVTGERMMRSTCMQGITVRIDEIVLQKED